jgi:hypothetical protein
MELISELEASVIKKKIMQDFSAIAKIVDMPAEGNTQRFLIEQRKFTDFLSIVVDKISPTTISVVGIDFFLIQDECGVDILGYQLDLAFSHN